MKDKNKFIEWIIIILIALVSLIVINKISEVVGINRRGARYLLFAIILIIWYFVDLIRNRKK